MISTIIIFGSNGMLGNYISKFFGDKPEYKVICVKRSEFEISSKNMSKLDTFLGDLKINENTCVINCSGLIPQRISDKEDSEYFIINSVFPLYLDKICQKYGAKLICPTTDCVFSGKKGDYLETDYHDEMNSYGISKSLGEPSNATVIRTSIIGEEKYNKKSFLEFVKNSNGEINGWNNHYWNGITCFEYCKIIDKIIKENLFWKGIRHVYSPEKKSKFELASIIKDVYNLNIKINKYEADVVVDKTLASVFEKIFDIPKLEDQIMEQSKYRI